MVLTYASKTYKVKANANVPLNKKIKITGQGTPEQMITFSVYKKDANKIEGCMVKLESNASVKYDNWYDLTKACDITFRVSGDCVVYFYHKTPHHSYTVFITSEEYVRNPTTSRGGSFSHVNKSILERKSKCNKESLNPGESRLLRNGF